MKAIWLAALYVMLGLGATTAASAQSARNNIWQGSLHLGDSPQQFSNVLTAGMVMQIPCKLEREKKGKLVITTRDIQTLRGEGHYAELIAHFEDQGGDSPANESVVETFRLKGDSTNEDVEHTFEFDPAKELMAPANYYSIRIRVDTFIKFSLWDDFVMKRIDIEQ